MRHEGAPMSRVIQRTACGILVVTAVLAPNSLSAGDGFTKTLRTRGDVKMTVRDDTCEFRLDGDTGTDDDKGPWRPAAKLERSARSWCDDSLTVCWNPCRTFLGGLRFIAEPRLGTVIQGGMSNRVEPEGFGGLTLLGAEVNLRGAYIAAQGQVIMPGNVTLDEQSPARLENRLNSATGTVHVDVGWGLGLSFFDGVFAAGVGQLYFDKRQFTTPEPGDGHNTYFYINFQPISSLRTALKHVKNR